MTPEELELQGRAAALHEAAHAIVARACGFAVYRAEVDDDGIGGIVRFRGPADQHTPAGRTRYLAVSLAGGLAEAQVSGREAEYLAERRREVLELADDEFENSRYASRKISCSGG